MKPQMQMRPVLRKLPRSLLEGIGAVCFEWALLERELAFTTYYLLNVSAKHGRVSVRSPRAPECLSMIRQLMGLEGITVESVDLDALGKSLGELEKIRDWLAHGIWLTGEQGEILLQNLSGNWTPPSTVGKIARRITPESVSMDITDTKEAAKLIAQCAFSIQLVMKEIVSKLAPSRRKSQPQSESDHLQDDSSSGKNEPRHRSS